MNKVKVFKLNDYEWYAGYDLESCIELAMQMTGMSREEVIDDPFEETQERLDTLIFYDEENDEKRSFSEELRIIIESEEQLPTFFAGTEY